MFGVVRELLLIPDMRLHCPSRENGKRSEEEHESTQVAAGDPKAKPLDDLGQVMSWGHELEKAAVGDFVFVLTLFFEAAQDVVALNVRKHAIAKNDGS